MQHRRNRQRSSLTTPSQVQELASRTCIRCGQEMAQSTCLSRCERVQQNAKPKHMAKTLGQITWPNSLCSLSKRHPPKKQDQDWLQQPQHYACCTCPCCLSKCHQYLQDTPMHWSAQHKQCLVRPSVDDWFCDTACCCQMV